MKFEVLYQRALNNKINTFQVEVENSCFRTITGFTDGIKTTSEWTCCEPKNTGKKNATTSEEQAIKEAEALIKKKKELGFFEDINQIDQATLFKPMLAVDWFEHKDKIDFPLYVQPKLDGVRCIVRKDGMWTRNGKQIVSAPHIYEALQHKFNEEPDLVLDGELYFHDKQNFNKIISLVKKTKPTIEDLEESKRMIQYWIYDVPSIKQRYDVRKVKLNDYIHIPHMVTITTHHVENEEQLKQYYSQFIEKGYEGLMVRVNKAHYENKRSKNLLKYKTFTDEEYEILDVIEGGGNFTGKCGGMLFKTKEGKEFTAVPNGSWEYLEELLKNKEHLIGKLATVKYFELTETNTPRFPKIIAIRDYE